MASAVRLASTVALLAGMLALAVTWRLGAQHWLAYHTGSLNTPGSPPNYNFWSGFGSDLGEYSIAAGLFGHIGVAWRSHTCHRYWWCWRAPRFELEGTPYMLCRRHHPCPPPPVGEAVDAARAG